MAARIRPLRGAAPPALSVAVNFLASLVRRKECWTLTRRAWILLGTVILLSGGLATWKLNGFLTVTARAGTDALVLEGWMPDYALAAALGEFTNGHYSLLITAGGPLPKGEYLSEYKSHAEFAAATLLKMGLDPHYLVSVPAPRASRNRTYVSALAVRKWLDSTHPGIRAVNVFSCGAHSRRSWLLFRQALGDDVKVGIVAGPDEEYDPRRWWVTSAGVRDVLGETIAYMYLKLFFHPKAAATELR